MSTLAEADIRNYYLEAPSYLSGALEGTCHFGRTTEGEEFEIRKALRSMEDLLAAKLALPAGSSVLDGGMGFGRVATRLDKEYGLKVYGLDLTFARLQEASRFIVKQKAAQVNPINANYGLMPLPTSSMDGVFTMETLVHADPLEQALAEFRRVLKPGGKLVLFEYSSPDRSSLDPVSALITGIMNKRTGMASMHRFSHGAFPGILTAAGFENIEVEEISTEVYPTWEFLFYRALHANWISKIFGPSGDFTNAVASLMIWPYRKNLGYNVVTATKPMDTV